VVGCGTLAGGQPVQQPPGRHTGLEMELTGLLMVISHPAAAAVAAAYSNPAAAAGAATSQRAVVVAPRLDLDGKQSVRRQRGGVH